MIDHAFHVKIARSDKKGRFLLAKSDIPAGTIIIKEPPYASVSKSPFFCSPCFSRLLEPAENRPFVCNRCSKESGEDGFSINDKSLVILCYKIVLRMVSESNFSYEMFFKEFHDSENLLSGGYIADFRAVAKLITIDLEVSSSDIDKVCRLVRKRTDQLSWDQIQLVVQHVFSSLPCNVQGVRCITEKHGAVSEERIGSGLYLTLALMNHSCSPNTRIYFENSDIVVVTTVEVKQGEELFHNYGPDVLHFPKHLRQQILERQYQFTCDCNACSVDGSKEPQYALQCEHCSNSVWLESDAPKCDSCAGVTNVQKFHLRIELLNQKLSCLEDNSSSSIHYVDSIVEEAKLLYSPESVMFGNIMDTCALFYAAIKVWDKAIECSKASCHVIEAATGKQTPTYALELLKSCDIRIEALENRTPSSQLREDVLFCVDLLKHCKYVGLERLSKIIEWSDSRW